jgi:hypothetical protein
LQAFGDVEDDKWTSIGDFAVALYNGRLVGLKRVFKKSVDLNRNARKDLLEVICCLRGI